MIFKDKLEDYTETEFLEFLRGMSSKHNNLQGQALAHHLDRTVEHFIRITEHPAQSDVLFYPEAEQEEGPEGVLMTIRKWRAQNGKPGFKS